MELNLPTLFWVLNLSYATSLLFAIALYRLAGSFPGAKLWISAIALAALGSLLFAIRSDLPYSLVVLANLLMIGAQLLYAHAVWAYRRDVSFPYAAYLILPLMGIALFILGGTSVNVRNILVSLVMALLGGWTSLILLRGSRGRSAYVSAMTAIPFLLVALGNLAQIGLSLSRRPTWNFETLGEGHAIVYLLAIATSSFSVFGFFLLATQRRQGLLAEQGRQLSEANANLLDANERLREGDRVKDLFVSMLAHDLRGPIAGAARYSRKHLLPEDVDLTTKRRALDVLASSLERATALLDNVLLWSRGRIEDSPISIDRVDVGAMCTSLLRLFGPTLAEKSIDVERDIAELSVEVERESMELIIRNMLSNAAKFSPPGTGILVRAEAWGTEGVRVTVADRGGGISPEIRERLFKIEARFTMPGTAGERGTGLGLILCALYAARVGGVFELLEREGGGTEARLTLKGHSPAP